MFKVEAHRKNDSKIIKKDEKEIIIKDENWEYCIFIGNESTSTQDLFSRCKVIFANRFQCQKKHIGMYAHIWKYDEHKLTWLRNNIVYKIPFNITSIQTQSYELMS